jgi:hypothetical protein
MSFAVIELLLFDNSRRVLDFVPALAAARHVARVYSHPEVRFVDVEEVGELMAQQGFRLNEIEFLANQEGEVLSEFLASACNDCWQIPDIAAEGDERAQGGKYFDIEANIRWQEIADFPSYVRVVSPVHDSSEVEKVLRMVLLDLEQRIPDVVVSGHVFIRPQSARMLTDQDLDSRARRSVWTEEWKRCWYEPVEGLIAKVASVEELHGIVGGRIIARAGSLAAIMLDDAAKELASSATHLFLKARLQPFVRPHSEVNGEYLVNDSPMYTGKRFQELIRQRLIRPLIPQHVIQPLLNPDCAAYLSCATDDVIALDVHAVGARRFLEFSTPVHATSVERSAWRDLHVSAWKRAFGLRADIVQFLCEKYFDTEN